MNKITFEKATLDHKEIIFSWLAEPHIQAFWDNTQEHKDDILNFMDGRVEASAYCDGKYVYWIAKAEHESFAMLMTIQETAEDHFDAIKLAYLSKTGHTYGIDYMIGNKNYFGKGLGAKTLEAFVDFFRSTIDLKADTFLIDPASDNPKVKHVYMKAGFEHVTDFIMGGNCSGAGKLHHLLIKRFSPKLELVVVQESDYTFLVNLSQLFIYELSRFGYPFEMLPNGIFKRGKLKKYLYEETRSARFIKIYDEIAGFVLINQICYSRSSNHNLAEFFILAKFQRSGIGSQIAHKIWDMQPGVWEVMTLPYYTPGVEFWDFAISTYVGNGGYQKEIHEVTFDKISPKRLIFTFDSGKKINKNASKEFVVTLISTDDIEAINKLSYQKRRFYEKAQPQFWQWAGEAGEKAQRDWFLSLLENEKHILLVAKQAEKIEGFLIGKITKAPEVYNPGGFTLIIDDFCVKNDRWQTVGGTLISEARQQAKQKGASQVLVVCGAHDALKSSFLKSIGLSLASEWFVGGML